jgi:23S rRNA pseudouridine1911/1915/1917 synthase
VEQRFRIGEDEAQERLDHVLAQLSGSPRAQVRRWIDAGRVWVNGVVARASQKARIGDEIVADPPEPVAPDVLPQSIPLTVLYEDEALIVLDKPAGLVVHPAPGHPDGTLVNALLHHCTDLAGIGGVLRPGIVHRLDQGTSGVLVAAKSDAAHHGLSEQFRDHSIERVYQAFVRGLPGAEQGRVTRPIGRHPRDRKRMSVATRHGRAAETGWRVALRFAKSEVTLLEIRPETGRTHQIRVHLASAGLPILGDPVYGRSQRGRRALALAAGLERPALHAAVLGFTHPIRGERMRFEASLPADLAELEASLRQREGGG